MAISGSEIRRNVGETNSELVVLKQLYVQSVDALKTDSELVVLKQLCVQSEEASKTNSELVVLKQLYVQSADDSLMSKNQLRTFRS